MGSNSKKRKPSIQVEQHTQQEIDDIVASIRRTAKEAWLAALRSRGLQKIGLVDIEFDVWWRERLEQAKKGHD